MKITKLNNNQAKVTFNNKVKNNGLEIQSDKYLFDNDTTVGFRKDKKLHKFVGIRNGYSKQLEFSLESIIIDGNEKISSNRVNFSNIINDDDVIVHSINSIDIKNNVNLGGYKNLVQVNESFNDIEILYEIHISEGMIVNNFKRYKNGRDIISPNHLGQFFISDESNKNTLFVIDRPVVFYNSFEDVLNIVTHELWKEDDKYFYKKTIRENKVSEDKYPLYIDANVTFNTSTAITLKNTTQNYTDIYDAWEVVRTKYIPNYTESVGYASVYAFVQDLGPGLGSARLHRSFLTIDVSTLGGIIGSGTISDVTLTLKEDPLFLGDSGVTYTVQKSTSDVWDSNGLNYKGDAYVLKDNPSINYGTISSTGDTFSVPAEDLYVYNTTIYNDFVFGIRSYNYDYNYDENVLPLPEGTTISNRIDPNVDLTITYGAALTGSTTFTTILNTDGFGVLQSISPDYDDAISGNTGVYLVHSSPITSYNKAIGYSYSLATEYQVFRTFLSFDTSYLDVYNNSIIKEVRIRIRNYGNTENITVLRGTQDGSMPLVITNWMDYGEQYVNVTSIPSEEDYYVTLNLNDYPINTSGYTNFVLMSTYYDYEGNSGAGDVESFSGIDFDNTVLEIDVDPFLINGLTYIKAAKGSKTNLYANKNTTDGLIRWSDNSGFTNIIGNGNVIEIDTSIYESGDIIYAAVMSGSVILSNNILEVVLDLYNSGFESIGLRDITNHYVDIDSVYWKYHKCISGICYAYVRELGDAYEQNIQVSDGEGLGSYNMYTEFDIIDEFFSNSHQAEVAAKLDEIELEKSQKVIDGQKIHEGTRVFLYSTEPTVDDGIYVADYNLKLHKIDELDTVDKSFRYKLHINAGTYLDFEFHTFYYNEESVNTSSSDFVFDILDGSIIYGDDVFDFGKYSDILFDSNEE